MTQKEEQASSTYTFHDLNQDLDALYEILRQENFNNHEIQRFFNPIISKIPNQQSRRKFMKPIIQAVLIMLTLILTIYLLTYWDTFYWNLTALTRIFMIRIIPYFDWRHWKNEPCLVRTFFDQKTAMSQSEETFNCDLCESLSSFDQITYNLDQNIEDLIYKFIDIDRPIIVRGGLEHWSEQKSPEDFVDQLINEREVSGSIPCKVSTNIHNLRMADVDVGALIRKSRFFDSFFVHFQNCELQAVKVFRKYTYRPKILPVELSPVTYNWFLWNRNYNATKFKRIDLVEKYTVIGQIFGKTNLNLVPRKNCVNACPILEGVLLEGRFLVLTSMWDVEYMPDGSGENLAAILEIKG